MRRTRLVRAVLVASAMTLISGVMASSAWATFPGLNGEIALAVNDGPEVWGVARISPAAPRPVFVENLSTNFYYGCVVNTHAVPARKPRRIARLVHGLVAFQRNNALWLMNADGSHQRELVGEADEPSFSPDGEQIAFERDTWVGHRIETISVHGGVAHFVTRGKVPVSHQMASGSRTTSTARGPNMNLPYG